MIVYDTNQIQNIAIENNNMYSNKVEQQIRIFKEKMKNEIKAIFDYYHIIVNYNSIENMIENMDSPVKNNLGYKKIMIQITDAIGELKFSKQKPDQILTSVFENQRQANYKMDIMEIYMELAKNLKKLEVNSSAIDELLSSFKINFLKLQNEIKDLTDEYIRINEKQISSLGQEFDNNLNNVQNDMSKKYIQAINQLDEEKAITFLQNEFSMLDNKQIDEIISKIIHQLPFGNMKLEEFLKEEQKRIKNPSLVELENLLK